MEGSDHRHNCSLTNSFTDLSLCQVLTTFQLQNLHRHFYPNSLHPTKPNPNPTCAMMKVFPSQLNWNGLFLWIFQKVYLWYLASHLDLSGDSHGFLELFASPVFLYCLTLCINYHPLHLHMQDLIEYFYASILYSCLRKLFISHLVFSASSPFTKILLMIYSTLSLMQPIFNNCSAHQILGLSFIF